MRAQRKWACHIRCRPAEYERQRDPVRRNCRTPLHIPDAQKSLVEQANFGNYDGDRSGISEMDAVVAYLQVLGTMVDFSKYTDDAFVESR